MNPSPPNLFDSLFEFRPRDGHTSKENFLTESFAYLLRTDEAACNAWLSCLLGRPVRKAACEVKTRQSEKDLESDTSVYPDLVLDGYFPDGDTFAVYCEHKWDSPCDKAQLTRYHKIAEAKGKHACLAFVGANHRQWSDAANCFQDKSFNCLLWEDVFQALDGVPDKSPLLAEFLDFMKTHGLSPAPPLTVETMKAFLQASDFLKTLKNMANKLNTNFPWEVIPKRFHADTYVEDRYGRVAIRFETKDWRPGVAVGFLYDGGGDHKVALVNPEKGIDLLLRIEAYPKDTNNIEAAMTVLKEKRKELRKTRASVLLKGEPGNGNDHTVMICRECLGNVIEDVKNLDDQLGAIHERLTTWLQVLFEDGTLEKAFKRSGLDSGMK